MIKFQSLLSSSSGNATYITDDKTAILIDCGASGNYIKTCLARLETDATKLSGIFLTHAHSDHIGSAGVLARSFKLPLYATAETFFHGARQLGKIADTQKIVLAPDTNITIGSMTVHAFSIPHDAPGAVSYTIKDMDSKFGIATDVGFVTDEMLDNLVGCDTVIVESNHDIEMLKQGPYPYPLKARILGDGGHLSNEACGIFCAKLAAKGTRSFWLGHLSAQNNQPRLAYACVSRILEEHGFAVGTDVALHVIPKYWIEEIE